MQDLIVSMIRFSAAVTLYGMEQIQNTLNVAEGEEDFSKMRDKFQDALDSLTETLKSRIDDKKQETLKTVTKMSEEVVQRTADGMTAMDPREIVRATNDLIQKTSSTTSDWVSKASSAFDKESGGSKASKKASA